MEQFLLDSHAHLDDSQFDTDRGLVIERARAVGMKYLLAISGGSGPDGLASAVPIAEQVEWIYASVGIHPHEARHATEAHFSRLPEAAKHPKVIALGEIGLDYHYDHSPRDVQQTVFIRQLEIARALKLPILIHNREAWDDLGRIVEAHWKPAGIGGILHCFSGGLEEARRFIEWGFLVSFAGTLTFKKALDLRMTAREVDLSSLLVETDCPYLAPVPFRGKRNEPAYVGNTLHVLAEVRGMDDQEMGAHVIRNFERLFRFAP